MIGPFGSLTSTQGRVEGVDMQVEKNDMSSLRRRLSPLLLKSK